MYFYQPADVPPRELAPGFRIRTMWGERIMLSLVELDPKAEVPEHTHPHEQMGIVLDGVIHMTIGGQARTLHQGDVYLVPPNVPHMVTMGDAKARVVDLFSPPREEYKG